MKLSISKINIKYLGIICHLSYLFLFLDFLNSVLSHLKTEKVQFCIMVNEYLLTEISGSVSLQEGTLQS